MSDQFKKDLNNKTENESIDEIAILKKENEELAIEIANLKKNNKILMDRCFVHTRYKLCIYCKFDNCKYHKIYQEALHETSEWATKNNIPMNEDGFEIATRYLENLLKKRGDE